MCRPHADELWPRANTTSALGHGAANAVGAVTDRTAGTATVAPAVNWAPREGKEIREPSRTGGVWPRETEK